MMSVLSETTIPHLIQDYGLWIVFIVVMSESMGVPLPGETTLVAAGIYAGSTQGIDPYLLVAVAAAAAVLGDNIGYVLGRTIGLRLLLRYGRYVNLTEARLKLGRYLFFRHGGKIVFIGRFVALLRALTAVLAGVDQMPWPRFLLFNACGGSVGRWFSGSEPICSVRRSGRSPVRSPLPSSPSRSRSSLSGCSIFVATRRNSSGARNKRSLARSGRHGRKALAAEPAAMQGANRFPAEGGAN
jgi:membrane protein DedA with SNARE-associated domain